MNEVCENCGGTIGQLETPRVYQDHVVCGDCWTKLNVNLPVSADPLEQLAALQHQTVNRKPPPVMPGVVVVNQHTPGITMPKAVNALGVAATVIGIIAVLICWVPFVGLLALPLGFLAALFAVIGLIVALTGGRSGVGFPVAGLILGIFACVLPIVILGGISAALSSAASRAGSTTPPGSIGNITSTVTKSPDLTIQLQTKYISGIDSMATEAWAIRNNDTTTITINRALYNGEFNARVGFWDGVAYQVHPSQWPMKLTVGEVGYLFVGNPGLVDYKKNIIFIDLYTDSGAFRYKDGLLAPLTNANTFTGQR
jgi:hypothetical protein